MKPPLSYIPLLPLLAAFVTGVLLCGDVTWIAAGISMIVLSVGAVAARRNYIAVIGGCALLGLMTARMHEPAVFAALPPAGTVMEGVVTDISDRDAGQMMTVDCKGVNVRLFYQSFIPVIRLGDEVTFKGVFNAPGIDTDLPDEDDLSRSYHDRYISLRCFSSEGDLAVTGERDGLYWKIRRSQRDIADMVFVSGLDEGTAALTAAMITGDDSMVDAGVRDDYAVAGIAHLLALSGAHVAVVVWILGVLFLPLSMAGHRKWRWGLTLAALWCFAVMTGLSASVVRASIMASAVIGAIMLDRRRSSLNSLCLSALLILFFDPFAIYRVGFQLSFAATLSIILFSDRLNPFGRKNLFSGIAGTISVTLGATLGTLPLVAYHFHRIPVYFILTNLVAVAVVPILIGGGFMLVFLMLLGMDPGWLIWAMNMCGGLLDGVSEFVASIPGVSVEGVYPAAWLLLPAYASVAALLMALLCRRRGYWMMAAALAAFTIGAYYVSRPVYPASEMYIASDKHRMGVLHREGSMLRIVTDDRTENIAADSVQWVTQYADYIGKRDISRVEILRVGDDEYYRAYPDSLMRGGGRTMKICGYGGDGFDTDYILVTRSFKGDIVEMAGHCRADTVILGSDINRRRRNRYADELAAAGFPCKMK